MTYAEAMTQAAERYLREILAQTGGNVSAAAQIAGIHRTHFYRLFSRFQVPHGRIRTPAPSRVNSLIWWKTPSRNPSQSP